MPENKLPKIVDDIQEHLFPGDDKPYRSKRILWIIRQYLRYVLMAAIHGYPVGPHRLGIFRLRYSFWEYIPWSFRKRFIFSSKVFGYEFRIHFESKILTKHGYYFNLNGSWKRRIREMVETDVVYDLIKEK